MITRRSFVATSAAGLVWATGAPAAARELPFRQVHLDFHTSEHVRDVAADFNAGEFVAALKKARVNSINVFAKCHHGYAYYDTAIAAKHPALKIDLLGEMVRACRASNIIVNYYYSLVWDVLQARVHPEWRALTADGNTIGGPPAADSWPWMCMNTPYMDQVMRENEEILTRYELNGAFHDILKTPPEGCYCRWCKDERQKLGLSNSPDDIFKHGKLVAARVEKRLWDLTQKHRPGALVFFNSRLVIGVRDELPWYSHVEVESLPTGGWGYTHFHQRIRYMRTLGKDCVGMTGRFHKSWGDFGGFKNQAALDYECLNFVANGAKASVGDQLHPRGRLDALTYARIGETFGKIEALEPWARGARAVADIGVMSTAAVNPDLTTQKVPVVDQGFTNMLLELHQQFDVLDTASDLSAYKVVILPDEIRPVRGLLAKIEKYLAGGGALIASGESMLDPAARRFVLAALGVSYNGPSKFKGEYLVPKAGAFSGVENAGYYLYQQGLSVAAQPGTEVLATYGHPYFDRTPAHFLSHRQTPMERVTDEPVITRRANVIYIANPFFRSYAQDGYGVQKQITGELLRMLLPQPVLAAESLPSTAQATLLQQGSRLIAHILYYPMTRRAPNIDIIEEPGLAENVKLRVRMPQRPSRVTLVPQNRPLEFAYSGSYASCTVPRVLGHQAVCFE